MVSLSSHTKFIFACVLPLAKLEMKSPHAVSSVYFHASKAGVRLYQLLLGLWELYFCFSHNPPSENTYDWAPVWFRCSMLQSTFYHVLISSSLNNFTSISVFHSQSFSSFLACPSWLKLLFCFLGMNRALPFNFLHHATPCRNFEIRIRLKICPLSSSCYVLHLLS